MDVRLGCHITTSVKVMPSGALLSRSVCTGGCSGCAFRSSPGPPGSSHNLSCIACSEACRLSARAALAPQRHPRCSPFTSCACMPCTHTRAQVCQFSTPGRALTSCRATWHKFWLSSTGLSPLHRHLPRAKLHCIAHLAARVKPLCFEAAVLSHKGCI